MDLKVLVSNAVFKKKGRNSSTNIDLLGNYFIVVQLDELTFPSKNTKTTKFRTEVIPLTTTPKFTKNIFTFEALNLGIFQLY